MIREGHTPVEVWAPAFQWLALDKFLPANVLSSIVTEGGRWCRMCEGVVGWTEQDAHVAGHREEATAWRKGHKTPQDEKLERLREIKPERVPQDCYCGCGGITKGGKFLPGHDAALKSRLIKLARNPATTPAEKKKAEAHMISLGWGKHVR